MIMRVFTMYLPCATDARRAGEMKRERFTLGGGGGRAGVVSTTILITRNYVCVRARERFNYDNGGGGKSVTINNPAWPLRGERAS